MTSWHRGFARMAAERTDTCGCPSMVSLVSTPGDARGDEGVQCARKPLNRRIQSPIVPICAPFICGRSITRLTGPSRPRRIGGAPLAQQTSESQIRPTGAAIDAQARLTVCSTSDSVAWLSCGSTPGLEITSGRPPGELQAGSRMALLRALRMLSPERVHSRRAAFVQCSHSVRAAFVQ